jgi:hypothetical protein
MSFRYADLVVDLSGFRCAQATAGCGEVTAITTHGFCPTASASLSPMEAALPDLSVLRTQLRAALGR